MEALGGSNKRTKPQSYLIFDTETTGLQGVYGNPRITELCVLGVHRDDLFEDGVVIPRVVNKLQLCVNPKKLITPGSSHITGLFNDALERQLPFNRNIFSIIHSFIQAQAQPTCLIAHNGNGFDYPLLAAELKRVGDKLPQALLCADSLEALRELDADPEGQSSHVGVIGQSSHVSGQSSHASGQSSNVNNHTSHGGGQSSNCEVDVRDTWNITEVTPMKRNLSSETESSVVHKKPKKDENRSNVDSIQRDRVARKLEYNPQARSIETEGLTNEPSLQSHPKSEVHEESDIRESSQIPGSEVIIHPQESLSNKMSFSCKASLSDDALMAAVYHMETNHPSNIHQDVGSSVQPCKSANQNQTQLSKPECDSPIPSSAPAGKQRPGSMLGPNSSSEKCSASVNFEEWNPSVRSELKIVDESRSVNSVSTNPEETPTKPSFNSLSSSTSNNEASSSTPSCPEDGDTDEAKLETSNLVSSSSKDNQHAMLASEKTMTYPKDPTHLTKTELNSQGSFADDDFLMAVQEMETFGDQETTKQTFVPKQTTFVPQPSTSGYVSFPVRETEICTNNRKGANFVTNMKISCEGNSTNQNISNVEQILNQSSCHQISNSVLLRANIQKSPFGKGVPGKRKSFRLPDIYKRHFGNLPLNSHTAEDDCMTLLKLVKKFSPKILEWVDDHCVPFDSVKPMY